MNPAVDALNHLLRQNPWAADKLRPYAGKTLRLHLPPLSTDVTLIDSGLFVPAIENAEIDASIRLSPFSALLFLAHREVDPASVQLEGDTDLAGAVGKILQQLEWEYEDDLSHLIGDIPAHELVGLGRRIVDQGTRQLQALGEMLVDYWQEEQPLIAKQRHLDAFSSDVDRLRDDIARLVKRIEKLEKSL